MTTYVAFRGVRDASSPKKPRWGTNRQVRARRLRLYLFQDIVEAKAEAKAGADSERPGKARRRYRGRQRPRNVSTHSGLVQTSFYLRFNIQGYI